MSWSCGSTSNNLGVDVSYDQGSQIQYTSYWNALRSNYGMTFGITKATEGTSYTDPYVAGAWSSCYAVNGALGTGLYHFIDWNSSGTEQADHFWSVVSGLTNPTFDISKSSLFIDIETNSTGTPSMTVVEDFMNELALKAWGSSTNYSDFIIYTNQNTWVNYLGNSTSWNFVPLWLAAMNGISWCPTYTFGGWTNWMYMQYGQATIEGVTTDVNETSFPV